MKKKAVAVAITDVHLTKDNGDLVKDIFRQAVDVCRDYGVNCLINAGDCFSNRSGQPLSTLTDFQDIVDYLDEEGITMFVIPGNHDKTDPDSERSYLDLYDKPNIRLFRKATVVSIAPNVLFTFIPYFKDGKWLEEFERIEESLNYNKVLVMITHSGFDGVRNNDGSVVDSAIKPSMFEAFDMVYIGHYHDASFIAENIRYLGSAYQNHFGENITDKGFNVIFDDGSFEFVPSVFPKYIKEVIQANDKETLRNLLEKYEGENYDHIRFLFKGKKTDIDNINVAEIQKYGIDVKFESTEEAEAIEFSESESVLLYDKAKVMKDFVLFASQNEIKGKQLVYGLQLIKNL